MYWYNAGCSCNQLQKQIYSLLYSEIGPTDRPTRPADLGSGTEPSDSAHMQTVFHPSSV